MSIDPNAPLNFVDEDGSSGSGEDVNLIDGNNKRLSAAPNSDRRKRSRKATGDAIVDAMLEIAAASKMRATALMKNGDRFCISRCIKVLDEMQGVDQRLYFLALDLFENPTSREIFISLRNISASMGDIDIELDEMELVAVAAGYYYYNSLTRQTTCSLSPAGSGFMTVLLNSHDDLAIFLNIVGHNERNRVIQERFQHSGETISRHFNNVLKAIKSLSREFLHAPPLSTPPEIIRSNRYYPYFKDCIGVIDGMHVPAHVPAKDQSRFRNKKGILSQNVLAACTFDLQFIFIYPGWEGAAADSRVLRAVLDDPDQNFPLIPEGKYYLVDTSYSNMDGFIAPYLGVRYHLQEYKGANQLPRNAKDLYNHRHASLRIVIQRCFDVLKARFPILKLAPQYAFQIQRDIVIAACVLHNYIRHEERSDWLFSSFEGMVVDELPDLDVQPDAQLASPMQQQVASLLRDSIASTMWNDFINEWNEW
ncbi:Harbinger transposase-derived nuclease domain [Dillenia turbinata]|uniref:Harbinger transposase-derived nuclease domain n=1 Tax=Dillenia turbinata TaxID=194707 RepID=A0AAN8UL71_9MAGN